MRNYQREKPALRRAEVQVSRLLTIYALLDKILVIRKEHHRRLICIETLKA
ncbi:MAG: hypothetical protein PHT79_06370 [Syntrophomonadaceae bacterium]|nr:hypothetical protein [Syntrophomonadaceae bacterium]MDD3889106.1 hypothetical protein [Syntrophomonadaceae bacterium]MDD4549369.1 hypothetical protein [Syntrophomonadaceae bacterium]